jgi:hypothetical protein
MGILALVGVPLQATQQNEDNVQVQQSPRQSEDFHNTDLDNSNRQSAGTREFG